MQYYRLLLTSSPAVFLNDKKKKKKIKAVLSGAVGNLWRTYRHTLGKVLQEKQHPLLEAGRAVAEFSTLRGKQ